MRGTMLWLWGFMNVLRSAVGLQLVRVYPFSMVCGVKIIGFVLHAVERKARNVGFDRFVGVEEHVCTSRVMNF